jgi:hypothetical protein
MLNVSDDDNSIEWKQTLNNESKGIPKLRRKASDKKKTKKN